MSITAAEAALREHLWAVRGENAEWATAYHQTIRELRQTLISEHLGFHGIMEPLSKEVHAARMDDPPKLPSPTLFNAYISSMMAAGYSYTLAAVLERAEQLDEGIARKLAALADDILTNGGCEEICADVWQAAEAGRAGLGAEPTR